MSSFQDFVKNISYTGDTIPEHIILEGVAVYRRQLEQKARQSRAKRLVLNSKGNYTGLNAKETRFLRDDRFARQSLRGMIYKEFVRSGGLDYDHQKEKILAKEVVEYKFSPEVIESVGKAWLEARLSDTIKQTKSYDYIPSESEVIRLLNYPDSLNLLGGLYTAVEAQSSGQDKNEQGGLGYIESLEYCMGEMIELDNNFENTSLKDKVRSSVTYRKDPAKYTEMPPTFKAGSPLKEASFKEDLRRYYEFLTQALGVSTRTDIRHVLFGQGILVKLAVLLIAIDQAMKYGKSKVRKGVEEKLTKKQREFSVRFNTHRLLQKAREVPELKSTFKELFQATSDYFLTTVESNEKDSKQSPMEAWLSKLSSDDRNAFEDAHKTTAKERRRFLGNDKDEDDEEDEEDASDLDGFIVPDGYTYHRKTLRRGEKKVLVGKGKVKEKYNPRRGEAEIHKYQNYMRNGVHAGYLIKRKKNAIAKEPKKKKKT